MSLSGDSVLGRETPYTWILKSELAVLRTRAGLDADPLPERGIATRDPPSVRSHPWELDLLFNTASAPGLLVI